MKKRLLAILLSIVLVFTTFAVFSASAATTDTKTVNGASNFNKAWEKTATYKSNSIYIGVMVYGYNTVLIKEDYVWTKAAECYSTPKIFRDGYDTSYQSGSQKGQNTYAKYEITHKTYYVSYRIVFSATYNNVTSTVAASTVK